MNKQYYTRSGEPIKFPKAYAATGAPMYETQNNRVKNINATTSIYKLNLEDGKKYIGKTTDVDRRMEQHFSGVGAKVTQQTSTERRGDEVSDLQNAQSRQGSRPFHVIHIRCLRLSG